LYVLVLAKIAKAPVGDLKDGNIPDNLEIKLDIF